MAITNPNHKTNLFGFRITNLLLYGLIGLAVLVAVKLAAFFSNLFRKFKSMMGFSEDESTVINAEEIQKSLEKDPAVKSQVTTGTRMLADEIFNAVNGLGVDLDALYSVFKKITGPNHMKAVFLAYGTRTVAILPLIYTNNLNLPDMLKWRLMEYQFNKNLGTEKVRWSIRTKLNWLKT